MLTRRSFLTAALAVPATAFSAAGREPYADRLGASTACLAGLPLVDAVRTLDGLGFRTIEMIAYAGARHSVGAIPGFAFDAASALERERVFDATRSFRHISCHLPFQDMRLFGSSADERRAGILRLQQAMDGLAFLKGELAVMHVGWPDTGMRFRDIWQPMIAVLRSLGDYAGARGLKLGIETMQPDSVRDYTELLFAVDHPHVGAVIDTGHIRGAREVDMPAERRDSEHARARFNDVLERLVGGAASKVLHVHLSDVRRTDWADHRAIGTGIVDFPRFFAALRRIAFKGLLVLELEEPDTVGALERSRAYLSRVIRAPDPIA